MVINMQYFRGKYKIINKPPATDIISLAEIKQELRIPSNITSQDASILRKLDNAVDEFMEYSQSGVLDTTFTADFYGFNNTNFRELCQNQFILYKQNIHTINKIEYAKNGVLTLLNQNVYNKTQTQYQNAITTKESMEFPSNFDYDYNNQTLGVVKVEFISGFGTISNQIPNKIKEALISYIRYYLNNTGDCGGCGNASNGLEPAQLYSLIGEYRFYTDF